jgi:hypothetical protein
LRKPTGYSFKLLELAADGTLLKGFTTDIAGWSLCATPSTG